MKLRFKFFAVSLGMVLGALFSVAAHADETSPGFSVAAHADETSPGFFRSPPGAFGQGFSSVTFRAGAVKKARVTAPTISHVQYCTVDRAGNIYACGAPKALQNTSNKQH